MQMFYAVHAIENGKMEKKKKCEFGGLTAKLYQCLNSVVRTIAEILKFGLEFYTISRYGDTYDPDQTDRT